MSVHAVNTANVNLNPNTEMRQDSNAQQQKVDLSNPVDEADFSQNSNNNVDASKNNKKPKWLAVLFPKVSLLCDKKYKTACAFLGAGVAYGAVFNNVFKDLYKDTIKGVKVDFSKTKKFGAGKVATLVAGTALGLAQIIAALKSQNETNENNTNK